MVGQTIIMKKGMIVELDIEGESLVGTINDITYFPPNPRGDSTTHIYVHPSTPTARKNDE